MADETGEVRTQKLDPEAEARRRLALSQIRQYPDPVLRMRAREVEEFDGDVAKLAERLTHLLREANGLGLAATQIGVLRRIFAFLPDPEQEPVVIVNPGHAANTRSVLTPRSAVARISSRTYNSWLSRYSGIGLLKSLLAATA